MYRNPRPAPASALPAEQRGRVVGRFCHACHTAFPLFTARHRGKPLYGKDHISSPCAHEGDDFTPGEVWWEPAVEVLAPVPAVAPAA